MNQPTVWRLGVALFSLFIILVSPAVSVALQIPGIPHPVAGQEDCLGCHQGRSSDVPPLPKDHSRQNNNTCQDCHLPALAPFEVLPTPIAAFPAPAGADGCRDCHAGLDEDQAAIANQRQTSNHARSDVSCVHCHGGDPLATSQEAAKSTANYIGVPDRADIPSLCASCHADVDLMRQYNLPADQYTGYQLSIHGYLSRSGDDNAPVCSDCHNSHQTLAADDPESTIHPLAVPVLCAGCHSDQDLMASYGTRTDQYDLFKESVHGRALIDDQNLEAPTCATCHGAHGAGPPGFEKANDKCGHCHTGARDQYLQSPHARVEGSEPDCVTCHGRYDVRQAGEELFQGNKSGHCGACHPPDSQAGLLAETLHQEMAAASGAYTKAAVAVQAVRDAGLPAETLEEQLYEVETGLTAARELQHTLDVEAVRRLTGEVQASGGQVKMAAETAISDRFNLYIAGPIILVAAALAVLAVVRLRRGLTQSSEPPDSD